MDTENALFARQVSALWVMAARHLRNFSEEKKMKTEWNFSWPHRLPPFCLYLFLLHLTSPLPSIQEDGARSEMLCVPTEKDDTRENGSQLNQIKKDANNGYLERQSWINKQEIKDNEVNTKQNSDAGISLPLVPVQTHFKFIKFHGNRETVEKCFESFFRLLKE